MPSEIFNIAQLSQAVQYTGANSADILAAVSAVTLFSEGGGTLILDFNGNHITFATTDWVIFNASGVSSLPNTLYLTEWDCIPTCAEMSTGVSALGISLVPALDPSDSVIVPVLLSPPMPNTTYTAFVSKVASVSTSDLAINSVTVVDTDTVNVLVQNMGLFTISGASIIVHAID
jgi:hypothetical protein